MVLRFMIFRKFIFEVGLEVGGLVFGFVNLMFWIFMI